MTLADINDIAQLIAVFAVLGSLIFVGVQVRQSAAIARAQVHQQISDTFTVYLETLSNHSGVVFTGTGSASGMRDLSDEDLLRFSFVMSGLFKIWENAFYQYRNGFLDERSWQSNVKWMLSWYHMPGVQTWWSVRKDLFAEQFQAFLRDAPAPPDDQPVSAKLRAAAGLARSA